MFKRCHVLLNKKLCKYEGSMRFTKNQRPVCALHRNAIASGEQVTWASQRLLEWDKQQQAQRMMEQAALTALNIMASEDQKEM